MSSTLSIQELVKNVNAGDASAHPILQQRVDALLANHLATPSFKSMNLQFVAASVATEASAKPGPADEFLFSEPVFNAALLKSMSAQASGFKSTAAPARTAVSSDAVAERSDSAVGQIAAFQPVFDRMLSSEPDAHHVVICHLAKADDGDAIHALVEAGTSNGSFDQNYCSEWMSGVGEVFDALNIPMDTRTDGLFDWVGAAASKLSEIGKKVVDAVVAVLPSVDDIKKLANALLEMLPSAVARLIDAAKDFVSLMKDAFAKGVDFVKQILSSLLRAGWDIPRLLAKFKDLADDLFQRFIDALIALGSDVARKVVDWITTAAGSALVLAQQIYKKIASAGRSFVDFLKVMIGTSFIEGLIKTIIESSVRFCEIAGDLLKSAAKFVVDLLEKALSAHIHLVRHFANVLSANASSSAKSNASSKPLVKDSLSTAGAVVAIADVVAIVLAILYAPSYPVFTLSVLLLVFAPILVEFLMGVIKQKKDKPSEKFDPKNPGNVELGSATAKYVVFSDLHRGTDEDKRLGISYTSWNCDFYAQMLQKYYDAGFVLVENGDAEDFWNDATSLLRIASRPVGGVDKPIKTDLLNDIMTAHKPVYDVIEKFVAQDRFVKILGNHDMDLSGMNYSIGKKSVKTWDAMRIPARSGSPSTSPVSGPTGSASKIVNSIELGTQIETLVLHGHQVDDANCQDVSGIGRAVTTLGVFAGIIMNGVDKAGNVFGDMGAKSLQTALRNMVTAYLNFAGPTIQAEWVKSMAANKFTSTGPANEAAKKDYERPEKPTNLLGLNCLSEEPIVSKVKDLPMHVVMGHTHKTKAFQNVEPDNSKWSAFINSGTGGMLEKVLTCVEIVGTSASVVYHAAVDADVATKNAVLALSI